MKFDPRARRRRKKIFANNERRMRFFCYHNQCQIIRSRSRHWVVIHKHSMYTRTYITILAEIRKE